MYDHQLDSGITDFEGIFGLGLPYGEASAQSWLRQASRLNGTSPMHGTIGKTM